MSVWKCLQDIHSPARLRLAEDISKGVYLLSCCPPCIGNGTPASEEIMLVNFYNIRNDLGLMSLYLFNFSQLNRVPSLSLFIVNCSVSEM